MKGNKGMGKYGIIKELRGYEGKRKIGSNGQFLVGK